MTNPPDIATLEDYEAAVGRICRYTALIDHAVVQLIQGLISLDEETTACLLSRSEDLAGRCIVAQRLIDLKSKHSDFHRRSKDTLRFFQQKVCPRRNRYVHDAWSFLEGEGYRENRRVRAGKSQTGQPGSIIHRTVHQTPLEDLLELITVCEIAITSVNFLRRDFSVFRHTGQMPEAFPLHIDLTKYKFRDSFDRA